MKFNKICQQGKLIRRYKRFLADVELPTGETLTIHCPNTGSMKNCNESGNNVWFSESDNEQRKYPHTWEIIEMNHAFIGINTHRANDLVYEAISQKKIIELNNYDNIKREVTIGQSRMDFMLSQNTDKKCYVEVKNVTLSQNKVAYFPDAVTTRGVKHLHELMAIKEQGHEAVLLFCVQHTGVSEVRPARDIDPDYAKVLELAHKKGVNVIAYQAKISPEEICLEKKIPVNIYL